MRLTDLWRRLEATFGSGYAASVANDLVLQLLDGRTIDQALADGEDPADVWRAVVATYPERVPPKMR
jgi:hypothetical protein